MMNFTVDFDLIAPFKYSDSNQSLCWGGLITLLPSSSLELLGPRDYLLDTKCDMSLTCYHAFCQLIVHFKTKFNRRRHFVQQPYQV